MSLSQAFAVALFAGLLCAAPAAWACDTAEIRAVAAGSSLDRPVRGAECHRYTAHSRVPLWVEVEETYVGISALIGERRIESGVRRPWMETFLLEPNAAGESHFAIQAAGKAGLSGSYRLTVKSLEHHPDAAAIRRALDLTMEPDPAGAASAWMRAGRPREAAWMLVAQAWTDAYAGRIDASLTLLEDAASLVAETDNEADRARVAVERGIVLNEVRRYEDAAAILAPAVRSAARLEDPSLRAELHLAFGLVRHNRDSLDAARSEYEKAAALLASDPTPDLAVAVMLQGNLGGIHYLLGEPQAAFARYDQAEAIARDIGDVQNYAETLRNQAQLSANLGMFDRALVKFTEALEVFEARHQTGDVAYALRGIGSTYLGLGLFERAREFLELAIDRAEEAGDTVAAFSARLLLGDVYRHLGQAERALKVHEQALADSEQGGRAIAAARAAVAWAKDALAGGRPAEAVPRLKQGIATFRDAGYRRELADALYTLGSAHLAGDAARDARVAFEEAERLQRELGDDRALVLTLTRLARLHSEAGDHAEALATATEAADVLERARGYVSNSDLQASFFGSRLQPYDELVRLHLAEGERTGLGEPAARAALAAAERSRARALKDLLARGAAVERRGAAHAEVTAKLNGQLMRLRRLQESLDQATDDDARRFVTPELRETKASLRLLRLELEALDARLAAKDPIRRAILTAPPDSDPLAANLPDDVAVLAYYLGEEEATGWLIRHGSITTFSLPPSAELEQASLTAYELASQWDADPEPAYEALRRLGASLLPPLDAEVGLRQIVVVPDGALHRVPFAAIPMPGAEHTLLLDHFELTTAPAVGLIDGVPGPHAWPPAGDRMAVFAAPIFEAHKLADQVLSPEPGEAGLGALLASLGPLPYSTEEARRIEVMAKAWRVDVFEGADATKRVLRDPEFAGHDVIHFATHAVISHEFPELSGLVLSQVDADGRNLDGLLHLQEIYDLPIDAELVVLSACRTGRGRNLRGEGPVSLGRAFLLAGARRVLTTHWGIPDDVTAELMATFYGGILERGLTPAAALREAQLRILNDPSFGHPFFWAGFALAGTIVD